MIKTLLRWAISVVSLSNLTSTIISSYKKVRLVDGTRTIIYDFTFIRHCIEFARIEWGYYPPTNPVDLLSKPRLNKPRDTSQERTNSMSFCMDLQRQK